MAHCRVNAASVLPPACWFDSAHVFPPLPSVSIAQQPGAVLPQQLNTGNLQIFAHACTGGGVPHIACTRGACPYSLTALLLYQQSNPIAAARACGHTYSWPTTFIADLLKLSVMVI